MAFYSLNNANLQLRVTNGNDNKTGGAEDDIFQITEGADSYDGGDGSNSLIATALTYQKENISFDLTTGVFTADSDSQKTLLNFRNYYGALDSRQAITGSADKNIIATGSKNDRIFLSGGQDNLNGGGGINTLDASKLLSGVKIFLSSKTISTGDTISNFQNLVGTGFDDQFIGSDTANELEGGEGADIYLAAGGNDTITDTSGNDIIIGGDGIDEAVIGDAALTNYDEEVMLGGSGGRLIFTRTNGSTATIDSSTERVTVGGTSQTWYEWYGDIREGVISPINPGKRIIGSNQEKDRLTGDNGDDYLDGRKLKDVLTGGGGADEFAFSRMQYGRKLRDIIKDLDISQGDRILVNGKRLGLSEDPQITFSIATNAEELSDALGSSVILVYNQSNGNLIANLNGAEDGFGRGGVFANIGAGQTLTASEFGLI